MSPARVSTRSTKGQPARVSYRVKPVTLPTFSFYGHLPVVYCDGELLIGRHALPVAPVMSLVDFSAHSAAMAARAITPLLHGELDGLLEPLSQAERRDVRDMLDAVARQLALLSDDGHGMRQRLDAMIAALIGVADAIDGDCDIEPTLAGNQAPGLPDECELVSEDEGAQCDDEGHDIDHEPDKQRARGGAGGV